ncbi:MAG TPA: polysaccharide deacetylase family protein [Candidatus Saccharimonadales bacterium]|nr:polysaccharide deacetylase family protein [Candidatus Saccharimonadales bacterium]
MQTESLKLAEDTSLPGGGRAPAADSFDWAGLEYLADPQLPALRRRMVAETLFALGGARVAEALAKNAKARSWRLRNKKSETAAGQPRFAVLCYHRIGRGGVPVYSGLPAAVFESQMVYLRKHYRIVSLAEMIAEMESPAKADPAVAITFDDGYADLYAQAFPILQKLTIPATVYLTAGAIETGEVAWYDRVFVAFQVMPLEEFELPSDSPRRVRLSTPSDRLKAAVEYITLMRGLPASEQRAKIAMLESSVRFPQKSMSNRMLSWTQIRRMIEGGVSFGAHTMTHPVVSRLTETELYAELADSKKLIEDRIQQPALDFAFPFGKLDECGHRAMTTLSQLGYRSAATTIEGVNVPGSNPFFLKRVSYCEERSLAIFALQLSRLFLSSEPEQPEGAPFLQAASQTVPDTPNSSKRREAR